MYIIEEMGTGLCVWTSLVLGLCQVTFQQDLIGGTMHWRPTEKSQELMLTFRFAWIGGADLMLWNTSYYITTMVNIAPLILKDWTLSCTAGCKGKYASSPLTNLSLTSKEGFLGDKWKMADGVFSLTVPNKSSNRLIVSLRDSSNNTQLTSIVAVSQRNDTKRPNLSPFVSVLPMYRIPSGCNGTIRIFAFDGDGDYSRCRWADGQTFSNAAVPLLNEDTCELEVASANTAKFVENSTHTFDLVVEDYSYKPVMLSSNTITYGPFSTVPLKLTVRIGSHIPASRCSDGPTFRDSGTLKSGKVLSANSSHVKGYKFPYTVSGDNNTIVTSGSPGLAFAYKNGSKTHKTPITYKDATFESDEASADGIHLICGASYTNDGIPGEVRCQVLMVGDPDECQRPNICSESEDGKCTNLWLWNKCTYPETNICAGGNPNEIKSVIWKAGWASSVLLLLIIIIILTILYIKKSLTQESKAKVAPEGNLNDAK